MNRGIKQLFQHIYANSYHCFCSSVCTLFVARGCGTYGERWNLIH